MKKIFIGSSTNSLEKARVIELILNGLEGVEATCWCDDAVFSLSHNTVDELIRVTREFSGGIFILDKDDELVNYTDDDKQLFIPRDNVIAEAGMFIGVLGKESVVLCSVAGVKEISDFDGITRLNFDVKNPKYMREKLVNWLKKDIKDIIVSKTKNNIFMTSRECANRLYDVNSMLHISDNVYKKIRKIRVMNLAGNLIINPEVGDIAHISAMEKLPLSVAINKIMQETNAKMEFILPEPIESNLIDIDYKMAHKVKGSYRETLFSVFDTLYSKINNIESTKNEAVDRFNIYVMKISMPYAIFNVEFFGEAAVYNYVKIDLYSPLVNNGDERRSFVIWEIDNSENYRFFVDNFNNTINNKSICKELKRDDISAYLELCNE